MGWGKKKYGNIPSGCQKGHSHRSRLEASVCALIEIREKTGELELLQAEKSVLLPPAGIRYIADFQVRDLKTGRIFYIEAKGLETDRWRIIKKLWPYSRLGRLEVWKGSAIKPYLDEVLEPAPMDPCPFCGGHS